MLARCLKWDSNEGKGSMTSVTMDGVVEFRFYRPLVQQVTVVGDFNGWRKDVLPMQAQGDGWWHATAQLPGGDYRFRYLADGVWYTDFASYGIETCKQGCNSVLVVPQINDEPLKQDLRQVA